MGVPPFSYNRDPVSFEMPLSAEDAGCLESSDPGAIVPCAELSIKPCLG